MARAGMLRTELRHVHDQLDALEKGSRSRIGTPDPGEPPSGAPDISGNAWGVVFPPACIKDQTLLLQQHEVSNLMPGCRCRQ